VSPAPTTPVQRGGPRETIVGYDVHITRRANWWDDDEEVITAAEWAAVVAADPDLEMVGDAEARTPDGAVLRYDSPTLAAMITHPRRDQHGAWLDLWRGNVVVKNPDEVLLAKMRDIAGALGARVQGDEGEYYDS
jgi:hypothetical protein